MNYTLKKELFIRRERIVKRKLLDSANQIDTGSEVKIIYPTERYVKKVRELCHIDYPIFQEIDSEQVDISKLAKLICFDNEDVILLPCFNDTKYWIKIKIGDKEKFLQYMFLHGYFNNFFIVCPKKHIIYNIAMGEQEYEIFVISV